jgi:hypothetical protein
MNFKSLNRGQKKKKPHPKNDTPTPKTNRWPTRDTTPPTIMSEILEALKDAVNPKRREQATTETYDPKTRGPYADPAAAGDGQPEVSPPAAEAQDPGRAEQTDLSSTTTVAGKQQPTTTGPSRSPKRASDAGYGAPEGTYGPHRSRVANALDPRVDSDRDGRPSHGLSDVGPAAAKPVHREGGKYGLS